MFAKYSGIKADDKGIEPIDHSYIQHVMVNHSHKYPIHCEDLPLPSGEQGLIQGGVHQRVMPPSQECMQCA